MSNSHSSASIRTLSVLGGMVWLALNVSPASAATLVQNPAANNSAAVTELINAIKTAEAGGAPATINLFSNGVYTLSQPDNWEYGPNGLPQIIGNITINGQGATIQRASNAPGFRIFYVSGGLSYNSKTCAGLPAGTLNLENLTLSGGLAAGGNGLGQAGGGAGMGGAIFNQGTLSLVSVNLSGNTAQGGNCLTNGGVGGGGGIGVSATSSQGGGFGCSFLGIGGKGASGYTYGGGGGGGFRPADAGSMASSKSAGGGGGLGMLSDNGDGGDGGWTGLANSGVSGGAYGIGGSGVGGNGKQSGGGGGIGGGGGHGGFNGADGDGGFGGGGGGGGEIGGFGGFGGGGGSGNDGSGGGFAAGDGNPDDSGGGGGGGMGGAIFNHRGNVVLANCTLTGNTAAGGNGFDADGFSLYYGGVGGSGFGGAIFNLNGTVCLNSTTVASNSTAPGDTTTGSMSSPSAFALTNIPTGCSDGGALYNLAYGNHIEDGSASIATVNLTNSLLSGSIGSSNDLVNNSVNGSHTNTATINFGAGDLVTTSRNQSGATCAGDCAGAVCDHIPGAGCSTPMLTITTVANHPVLFWSTNFSGCGLQWSSNFSGGPGTWTSMTCAPTVMAGQFVVPDAPVTGSKFYRLVISQ